LGQFKHAPKLQKKKEKAQSKVKRMKEVEKLFGFGLGKNSSKWRVTIAWVSVAVLKGSREPQSLNLAG